MLTDLVMIAKYAELTGYSNGAIRTKLSRGVWRKGKEWFRAPDGHIFISIKGVERWIKSNK